MDYSWIIHRYLSVINGKLERLSVRFSGLLVASGVFSSRAGDFVFWKLNPSKSGNHKNVKDACRKMIAIRLVMFGHLFFNFCTQPKL